MKIQKNGGVTLTKYDLDVKETRLASGPKRGRLRCEITVTLSDDYECLLSKTMPTGNGRGIGYFGTFLTESAVHAIEQRAQEALFRGLHKAKKDGAA